MFLNRMLAALGLAIVPPPEFAYPSPRLSRGKGKGRPSSLDALHRKIAKQGRPTDARHWHQSDLPDQVDTLAAAYAKRERKARKLQVHTGLSYASQPDSLYYPGKHSLNPFYVNRG